MLCRLHKTCTNLHPAQCSGGSAEPGEHPQIPAGASDTNTNTGSNNWGKSGRAIWATGGLRSQYRKQTRRNAQRCNYVQRLHTVQQHWCCPKKEMLFLLSDFITFIMIITFGLFYYLLCAGNGLRSTVEAFWVQGSTKERKAEQTNHVI